MKPRHLLSAVEIAELHEHLGRQLDYIGIESQPHVALRLLNLISRGDATISEFAAVIRVDQAICARVLKLANSALFAQRKPVTTLDRACIVLGLERIRSISLGLYLSRAAVCGEAADLTREVWGQSVFRACMAAQMATAAAPMLVSEAFIVGLMLDAGIPLMLRLVGDEYATIFNECATPGTLCRREGDHLGFTHVDVVTVLARRWRFPEVLAHPVEWHHSKPPDVKHDEPVNRLHRIAYVVGLLGLRASPSGPAPLRSMGPAAGLATAQRVMSISETDMSGIVAKTVNEYNATIDLFSDVAARVTDVERVFDRVQTSLINALDESIETGMRIEAMSQPRRLIIGGQSVEIAQDTEGVTVAYLYDSEGRRLLTHRFLSGNPTSKVLCEAFGLSLSNPGDAERIATFIRSQAA